MDVIKTCKIEISLHQRAGRLALV